MKITSWTTHRTVTHHSFTLEIGQYELEDLLAALGHLERSPCIFTPHGTRIERDLRSELARLSDEKIR